MHLIEDGWLEPRRLTGLLAPLDDVVQAADALAGGHLLGAGLDVRAAEPFGERHPPHELDNVVLTPHIAGDTAESQEKIVGTLAVDPGALFNGRRARNPVGRHHALTLSRPGSS